MYRGGQLVKDLLVRCPRRARLPLRARKLRATQAILPCISVPRRSCTRNAYHLLVRLHRRRTEHQRYRSQALSLLSFLIKNKNLYFQVAGSLPVGLIISGARIRSSSLPWRASLGQQAASYSGWQQPAAPALGCAPRQAVPTPSCAPRRPCSAAGCLRATSMTGRGGTQLLLPGSRARQGRFRSAGRARRE